MPGITGIIAKGRSSENSAALNAMVQCMMHEDFYQSGTYVNQQIGLYIGWTCFAPGFAPIWNQRRDLFLIFTGEHYADDESEAQNLEWLLELYEKLGPQCLARLNGLFSGILVDLRKETLFLFNDRYGLSRIYYCEKSDAFYFSSEAKSLLKILPETREINLVSLGEFFSCGCVLQNRSLFAGISLLPGGSSWEFPSSGGIKKDVYFEKSGWESQPLLGNKDYYEKLKEIFPRVLNRYLSTKQKTGVSLTGGVDSRLIMAWAKSLPNTLPCYTFGGRYRDSIDVKVARGVAAISKQPYQVIEVGADFLREFPSLAERTVYLTDGAMDVSGSADLFVNKVARQIAPLRLTGNYGGEILRELIAFRPTRLDDEVFDTDFVGHMERSSQTYAQERNDRTLSFVAFKQVPWHHYSRLAVEQSQIVMRSPYLDNDLVQLAYQTPREIVHSNEPALRLIAEGNPTLGQMDTDRGVSSKPIPVVTSLVHQFQEFTFKAEYAYDYGMPQWLAAIDSVLAPLHLERIFLGRHKFHHFRVFYRDELSSYLKEILLDPRTTARPYLRGERLEEMVKQHTRGTRNYTLEFHRILTSELTQRQLIERN
jgi:asparagine synthase (glutamine-hydrolysing)